MKKFCPSYGFFSPLYYSPAMPSRPWKPDLHEYVFLVDGLRVNDPNNTFLVRDIATNSNIFLIKGGLASLHRVNQVPHGSVTRQWYESPGLGMTRRRTIYTPPEYDTSGEEYPVLYLLHGAGGDEETWIGIGKTDFLYNNVQFREKLNNMGMHHIYRESEG